MNTYFYPNSVTVQCNLDPTITARWKTMYQRQVKIYKGVDNIIQFVWKNSDQKAVNITGWVITFNMISDSESAVVVTKNSNTNGGITIVDAVKGIISVRLTAYDLIDLSQPYYNYALTVSDPVTGITEVVYTDENYESRGEILLRDGPYPTLLPSIVVDLPSNNNTTITSAAISADINSLQQSAHHTAQINFDTVGFTGNITVEGTLDSLALVGAGSPQVSWGVVELTSTANVMPLSGNTSILNYTAQTATSYCNFDGVYTAVRFVVAPTSGNVNPSHVTQILYRV